MGIGAASQVICCLKLFAFMGTSYDSLLLANRRLEQRWVGLLQKWSNETLLFFVLFNLSTFIL